LQAYFTNPDSAALWLAERCVRDLPGTYPAGNALEALGHALQEIVMDTRRLADSDSTPRRIRDMGFVSHD
jgi:hypothetical protein